jgi:hypothetical protein
VTTPTTVNVRLQLRADTAANWAAANPTLLANEVGLETDTKKLKVGSGSTAWNSLAYFPSIVTGGTVLGNLEIGSSGTLTFEGSTADGFETTLAVTNPTADRTITLPNQSGIVVVSGNASIIDADIAANAEIAVSKLADGAARQLLQTDAAGTGVEWASNIDVPGTLDVTGAATFDSSVTITGDLTVNGTTTNINTQNLVVEDKNIILADVTTPTDTTADGGGITLKGATDKTIIWSDTTDSWEFNQPTITTGSSTAASFIPTSSTVPSNGVYLSDTNTVAVATNSTGRLFVDASGRLGLGTSSPATLLHLSSATGTATPTPTELRIGTTSNGSDWSTAAPWGRISFYSSDASNSGPKTHATIDAIAQGAAGGHSALRFAIADLTTTLYEGMRFECTGSTGQTFTTFSTSGSERARITSDGKLGLGTSSPSTPLEVVATGTQADFITLFGNRNTTDTEVGILFKDRNVDVGGQNAARIYSKRQGTAQNYSLTIATGGSGTLVDRVTVLNSGNVEINAAAATSPFVAKINTAEVARLDSSGRLLVGTSSDSGGALFQVNGDRIRIGTAKTPASASATGATGEICWDASYIYVCTATNTWKRAALATW